ncbi:hypothetical protein [Haloferula sargassicola]|uniref:hypothetical protein n=1 Tax=Haloferula sargassicola TaxID=490096 RepID=UPI0033654F25
MKRRSLWFLAITLLTLSGAAWLWLRPYEWHPDPAAPAEIETASLRRDESYFWLDLRLDTRDLRAVPEPLFVETPSGAEIKPAQIDYQGPGPISGTEDGTLPQIDAIFLKFWLEESSLQGPLALRIGNGRLRVRTRSGIPSVKNGNTRIYHSSRW